jgi:hypothetical protein
MSELSTWLIPHPGDAPELLCNDNWRSCGWGVNIATRNVGGGWVSRHSPLFGWCGFVLCSGISDAMSIQAGPWCKRVWPRALTSYNLVHIDSADDERIRDHRAVTPPRDGLCAHDCRSPAPRQANQLLEGSVKFRSLHVIGKATEACVSPAGIDGVATRVSQTAEGRHMDVLNSGNLQGYRQLIFVKLRVLPRARDSSYIDQPPDAVSLEKCDKGVDGPCRVAHCPNRDAAIASS